MYYVTHTDGTLPSNGEIFVFGSNLAGIHGAGAAKVAAEKFGAVRGVGFGFQGQSFAIPTKGFDLEILGLDDIARYVEAFKEFAYMKPERDFFITRVGCGLAGYSDKDIAPMFSGTHDRIFNIAESWMEYIVVR